MTLRFLRIPAAIVFGTVLLASSSPAPAQNNVAPQSPYGGVTVEDIIARVNDQIITGSDYERAMKEVDDEARQRGATTLQEVSEAHKDLLRNLIDQQLWLSKGKELGVTGDTELVKRLDEYRKQYHLDTIEELEKAAAEQGVSFEDFKANVRNGIITQEVMRDEVGSSIRPTPGQAERFYEQHKQDYAEPESETLSEILVSTGAPGASDPAKAAAAKAKADDIETRLHAGGDFTQLAKSFSDGPTAAQGGELGQYQRGALPKALEDKTFPLKSGKFTAPILTRQGYVILKVNQHVTGGAHPYKDVEGRVEDALYMSLMEPAIREYLTKMREEAFIDIKPGYLDTGASPNETKPVFSAYTPPAPKKKAKVERTRFRESTQTFRQKSGAAPLAPAAQAPAVVPVGSKTSTGKKSKKTKGNELAVEKAGKKEKIRFGQKPRETLPTEPNGSVENAGALPETAANTAEPVNPLDAAAPEKRTRYSERAKLPKQPKPKGLQPDALAPEPADAAEVADREAQAGPLGLAGDTASKKKKKSTTENEKTRMANRKKEPGSDEKQAPQFTPAPQEPGAPAPARQDQGTPAPAPQPQQ
jgi:peptidyl-prolyl cis-trans isomerase SurA